MENAAPKYISLSEAAKELGYGSTSTLRLMAINGRIPGIIKIGHQWAVPVEWLEAQKGIEKDGRSWAKGAGTRKNRATG